MRDFNFFSPYLQEKRNIRQRKLFIIGVSALVVIGLLSFTTLNIYQMTRYSKEIKGVESYLNAKQTIEFLNKYQATNEKLVLTKSYYDKVAEAQRFLKSSNTVNTELLDKLSSVLPQDARMESLVINQNVLEIQYEIKNLTSAAEIEHNLKILNVFESVHAGVINNETGYLAIISCSLKDVYISETDK